MQSLDILLHTPQTRYAPEVMTGLLSVQQVLHYYLPSQSPDKGWTPQKSQLFWVALIQYPQGPWTTIAEFIGTKSARQVMTHGQKLHEKLKRWDKRLRQKPAVGSHMNEITVTSDGRVSLGSSPLSHHYVLKKTAEQPISSSFVKLEQSSHVKQEELRPVAYGWTTSLSTVVMRMPLRVLCVPASLTRSLPRTC